MTYSEANQILGCSLTPNNRCICKSTAITWHAQEGPLASFASNRLVPVSAVAKKYYVVFVNEGGTVISSGYYEPGAALNDPGVPSKAGYTGAWNNGYTGYATGDVTYSPVYTPDTVYHTVTFISDGSTWDTQSVEHGGYATEPSAPTKSGHTFTGWSPSVSSTQINGDTTFTAQFTEDAPPVQPVVMLADVGWKTADAGQGIPHGDPSNGYETSTDYLMRPAGPRIPLNVWFEPMYTSNSTELSYNDPIATVNGVSVSHNDLTWTFDVGQSEMGCWYWHKPGGGYNQWDHTIIVKPYELSPGETVDGGNWRISVQSGSEAYWKDSLDFTIYGSYNGQIVVAKTINIWFYISDMGEAADGTKRRFT